ncbi:MAG TPA: helix-turn-helix domain-containing protein [Acidimicrobiales bacterium]|jgi:predicted ArsR family transcriptional regulator|nr:helix-turn-helix domain-containing protein [Acidimicrobiales bacterium]
MSATDFASVVTAITSAFGDPTRREIYLFVHEHDDGVTASAVAQRFDLHPNVARHHLDKLCAGGYLDVAVARAGGGAGRPSKRYRVVAPDIALDLPLRHDDVLVELLGRALAALGPERAEQLAENVGVDYGRAMAASMGPGSDRHRSFQAALHVVADALTAHGFAAHAERHGGELRIVSEHCPFGGAPIEHPVICAVDRGMVRGMLEALCGHDLITETALSLPTGGEHCITAVQGN